jgi:hypothetical protein
MLLHLGFREGSRVRCQCQLPLHPREPNQWLPHLLLWCLLISPWHQPLTHNTSSRCHPCSIPQPQHTCNTINMHPTSTTRTNSSLRRCSKDSTWVAAGQSMTGMKVTIIQEVSTGKIQASSNLSPTSHRSLYSQLLLHLQPFHNLSKAPITIPVVRWVSHLKDRIFRCQASIISCSQIQYKCLLYLIQCLQVATCHHQCTAHLLSSHRI